MKAVRGHYDGKVVVLDEPAPVDHEVTVIVSFPENGEAREERPRQARRFRWDEAQAVPDDYSGSLADQIIRDRHEERF